MRLLRLAGYIYIYIYINIPIILHPHERDIIDRCQHFLIFTYWNSIEIPYILFFFKYAVALPMEVPRGLDPLYHPLY